MIDKDSSDDQHDESHIAESHGDKSESDEEAMELEMDANGRVACDANKELNFGFRSFSRALKLNPKELIALTTDVSSNFNCDELFQIWVSAFCL